MSRLQHNYLTPSLYTIFSALAVIALPLLSINAHAQTLQSSAQCNIPITRADWDTRSTTGIKQCNIQKFDQSLGELEQIDFTLTQESSGIFGLENTYINSQQITANIALESTFYYQNNTIIETVLVEEKTTYDLLAYDNSLDYNGDSGTTTTLSMLTETSKSSTNNPEILQAFTNSTPGIVEDYIIDIETSNISTFDSTNGYDFYNAFDSRASVEVIYNYTPLFADPAVQTSQLGSFSSSESTATLDDSQTIRSGGTDSKINTLGIISAIGVIGVFLSLFEPISENQ